MGSFAISTTSTNDITGRIEWSESNVNVNNNTSDLTVSLIYRMNSSWYATTGSGYFKITVNGVAYEDNHWVSFASGTHEYTVLSHTFTITHDANGAKSVSIVLNNGYVAGTTGLSASSGSGTATLTTIARASQPTATNGIFGSAITITTHRASTAFTHTIVVSFGSSFSDTIRNVGASTSFTVPASWAAGIPSAVGGNISISCTTYNGSTNLGTRTTTAYVQIPDSWKPSVTITKTLTDAGTNSTVLAYVTRVNLSASATASTGTTISGYEWSGGTVSGTGSSKTHSPTSAGEYTYTVTVRDARGRTGTATVKATAEWAASSISDCPSSVNFGSALDVSIARKKSTFTHVVRYRINDTYTQDVNDNNQAWTRLVIPSSWAASVPAASSINMTVTVITYNGSEALGEVSKTVAVIVPSSWVPTFTLTTEAVSAFSGQYLKGVSKVKLTASSVAASTGSQIQSYRFSGNNMSKSATTTAATYNVTSDLLGTVGSNTYTVTVTDKRGRVTTKTSIITVVNYSAPTIKLSVGRYNSGGTSDNFGGYGKMTATGTWSAVTGNTWTLTLKQKQKTASYYTTVNTYSTQTGSVSRTSDLFAADVDSAYDCQATLTDAVGKSVTVTVALSTGKALMDLFKDKVATFFSTASETLRQTFGNPSTLFYSGAQNNILNGYSYIPDKSSGDGLTDGWFRLNDVSAAHLLGNVNNEAGQPHSVQSGDNLNNYVYPGTYFISSNTIAQNVSNIPVLYAGQLLVIATGGGPGGYAPYKYIRQEYYPYYKDDGTEDHNLYYIRYGNTGTGATYTWTAWHRKKEISNDVVYGGCTFGYANEATSTTLYIRNSKGMLGLTYGSGGLRGLYDTVNANYPLYVSADSSYLGSSYSDLWLQTGNAKVFHTNNALNTVVSANSSKSISSGTVTELATVTPGKAGIYLILLDVNWSTDSSTTYILYISVLNSSNSTKIERYIRSPQSGGGGAGLALMYELAATDKIRFRCYQASGAASTARYNYGAINLRNT